MADAHRSVIPTVSDAVIRSASMDDAAEIARLLGQLGYPTDADTVAQRWGPWSAEGNSAIVAARDDGLAGFAALHRTAVLHRPTPVGRITALVVDAASRGQGIGRALVAEAEEELRRAGCGLVEITSNARRVEAHAFYEHIGYDRTSVRLMKHLASTQG
jgi:GNAT superfamily N-acetyltransferase